MTYKKTHISPTPVLNYSPVSSDRASHRNIWLLMGHKTGDNTQVLSLAETLGYPYEIKRLVYKNTELFSNILLGNTLAGIRQTHSSQLTSPWPDLIITAGRRNEPVARWIKKQSRGNTLIVHIGRPWADIRHFDLIISTQQYALTPGPKVLQNLLPLHRITKKRLMQEAAKWEASFAYLPRPYFAMLVGGNSGPYIFDKPAAQQLARQANTLMIKNRGTLLISTSSRTPEVVTKTLEATISVPKIMYQWCKDTSLNPYYAFLGLADAIIVSSESISMITEACATHKPVYMFQLKHFTASQCDASIKHAQTPWWLRKSSYRWAPLSHHLAMLMGPKRMKRNIGVIHQKLIQTGRTVWLGQEFTHHNRPLAVDDLQKATNRVRSLLSRA